MRRVADAHNLRISAADDVSGAKVLPPPPPPLPSVSSLDSQRVHCHVACITSPRPSLPLPRSLSQTELEEAERLILAARHDR